MAVTPKKEGTAQFLDAAEVIATEVNTVTLRESIVNVFPAPPSDVTPEQTLRLIEQSSTLDFWTEDGEDIYTHNDGEEI